MKHTAAVKAMVEWFFSNFEDPATGRLGRREYVFIWGGPCYARDELEMPSVA